MKTSNKFKTLFSKSCLLLTLFYNVSFAEEDMGIYDRTYMDEQEQGTQQVDFNSNNMSQEDIHENEQEIEEENYGSTETLDQD